MLAQALEGVLQGEPAQPALTAAQGKANEALAERAAQAGPSPVRAVATPRQHLNRTGWSCAFRSPHTWPAHTWPHTRRSPGSSWPRMERSTYRSAGAPHPQACWAWLSSPAREPEAVRLLPVRRDVVTGEGWRERVGDETAAAWSALLAREDTTRETRWEQAPEGLAP